MEGLNVDLLDPQVEVASKGAIALSPEPIILSYFETLNAGDFAATSALFAVDGAIHPPFESAIVGAEAIATYLQAEATGMQLFPREIRVKPLATGSIQVQVVGKVKTSWCGVNAAWSFLLNGDREITVVTIKLLALPQELLKMRRE